MINEHMHTSTLPLYPPASASEKVLPPVQEILKGILSKIPKSKRFKTLEWETTPRSRLRVTLGVPFIYRLYRTKKTQLLKAKYGNLLLSISIFPWMFFLASTGPWQEASDPARSNGPYET